MKTKEMSEGNVSDQRSNQSLEDKKLGIKDVVRPFIISMIMLIGLSYLIQESQFFDVPGGIDNTSAPYVSGILFFILIAVANLVLRGTRVLRKFVPGEMAVGYSVLSVGLAAAGLGVVGFTIGVPTFHWFAAYRLGAVYRPVFEEISTLVAVKDIGSVISFYRGGESVVPWELWTFPLITLTVFWALFFFFVLCLTVIYRKHWTEYEHLQYPLASAVGSIVAEANMEMRGKSNTIFIGKNKLFLIGTALTVAWGVWGLLHFHFPGIPMPSGYIMLSDYFTEPPWNAMKEWPGTTFYYDKLLLLGVAYLLALDVTFSIWLMYILFVPLGLVSEVIMGYTPKTLFISWEFSRGAFLGIAVILTWRVRHQLATIVRVALGMQKESQHDKDDLLSYKVAFWGGLASIGAIVLFCLTVLDMSLWFVLYLYLFVIANVVWFGRLRAEAGFPDGLSIPQATHYSLYNLFPQDTLGVNNAVGFSYYHVPHYGGYGTMWMGAILHNYKLGDILGVKRRTLSIVMLLAFIVGTVSGCIFALPLIYEKGFDNANSWLAFGKNQIFFHSGWGFQPITTWGSIGFGLIFVTLIGILRNYFVWFPLNPVAVPVVGLANANIIWGPFFVAWLVRSLVLRYGGIQVDKKVRPLFIGLIAGSVVMSVVSVVHGLVLRIVL